VISQGPFMVRIKKLDIFIFKQFALLFLGTFFICLFVLMMQFLWRYVDELIGKGLTMDVLAQFFYYMALMLMPQALPLAILLSSLITYGNLGESSELTAIKAAGISLMQSFRSLTVTVIFISIGSFYFQNVVGPNANRSFGTLLLSMKQKNPELEIPEGIFYDGIPNCNLYVQKKNMETGMLYGIMIYKLTNSYEDAAIILADSGKLEMTAEKKHLLLHLYSGEWFENMQSQELAGSASVPYRRETFEAKRIVLDFDAGFNMADASLLSNNAQGKSLSKISHDIDSLNNEFDSIGRAFYNDEKHFMYFVPPLTKKDSLKALLQAKSKDIDIDTIFARLPIEKKQQAVRMALEKVQAGVNDLEYKSYVTKDVDKVLRRHQLEALNKFTLALACIIFFFIGAPLGAIIRKGGLGIPVIVSVIVFIIYYIFDNSGSKMARDGMWSIWFGKSIATAVLSPLAIFFTYKANNDSVVFNLDIYKEAFRKLFGLRIKRHVFSKEVIITDPDYQHDSELMQTMNEELVNYSHRHHLKSAPNIIKVFYNTQPDIYIEQLREGMEMLVEDLSNTKDKYILSELNKYPILIVHAHTSPFKRNWLNVIVGALIPLGIFYYFRIWRFRLRLLRDLKVIKRTNENITKRIEELK
jgi:lipopolysaccharide export system permease protein